MFKITCPECANVWEVATIEAGSFIECPACHLTLSVESVEGENVKVSIAPTDK
jgi:uncharacterized paraquat-inducible protein A